MKVRWNACYAIGNVFKNPALPLGKMFSLALPVNILLGRLYQSVLLLLQVFVTMVFVKRVEDSRNQV